MNRLITIMFLRIAFGFRWYDLRFFNEFLYRLFLSHGNENRNCSGNLTKWTNLGGVHVLVGNCDFSWLPQNQTFSIHRSSPPDWFRHWRCPDYVQQVSLFDPLYPILIWSALQNLIVWFGFSEQQFVFTCRFLLSNFTE